MSKPAAARAHTYGRRQAPASTNARPTVKTAKRKPAPVRSVSMLHSNESPGAPVNVGSSSGAGKKTIVAPVTQAATRNARVRDHVARPSTRGQRHHSRHQRNDRPLVNAEHAVGESGYAARDSKCRSHRDENRDERIGASSVCLRPRQDPGDERHPDRAQPQRWPGPHARASRAEELPPRARVKFLRRPRSRSRRARQAPRGAATASARSTGHVGAHTRRRTQGGRARTMAAAPPPRGAQLKDAASARPRP